jgi:hypothetical protein
LRQRLQAPRLSLLPLPSVERLLVAGREQSAAALVDEVGAAALRDALARCRELEQVGEHGLFDELLARHAHMKRYLPAFLDLPFEGQPGTESLLAAIAMARQFHRGELREIPATAVEFATGAWRTSLLKAFDRRLWEIALAVAMGDALRSGDLYLPDSRHHVSFWNLVYDAERWERERTKAYADLEIASDADRLAKALTALGRIVKTTYILRYLHDPAVRDRVHLQLNRGESRHELARRLFFANQGAFRTGDYEEIMNKASALALLSNAVLVWNTVRISEIVASIEASGQTVRPEHLARISPLAHAHVIPSDTYHFDRATARARG